jgi:hypothetical protein
MGQTSYVYILWLVILAAGLWLIIGFGSVIHAREDLAGEWQITPEEPSNGTDTLRMKVEQSGRYCNITLSDGHVLRLKMTDDAVIDQRFGEHKRIVLSGNGATATFQGRSKGDLWRLSLDGNVHGVFVARLTDRMYPKPAPATQRASLSPAHAR